MDGCEMEGCKNAATHYGGYAGAGDWAGRVCGVHVVALAWSEALPVQLNGCAGCGTEDTGRMQYPSSVYCTDCLGDEDAIPVDRRLREVVRIIENHDGEAVEDLAAIAAALQVECGRAVAGRN
jgi:hypothetical protein